MNTPEEIWKDSPDIEYSVVELEGSPVLVLQTREPVLVSDWLTRDLTTVETRLTFQLDDQGRLQPQGLLVFTNYQIQHPLLATSLNALLGPLVDALRAGRPWTLLLQVEVENKPFKKGAVIHGQSGQVLLNSEGNELFPGWAVKIVDD